MRDYIYTYKIRAGLLLMAAALLLTACSDDSDTAVLETDVLRMAVYTQNLTDEELPAETRGAPSGYSPYTPLSSNSIRVFLTQQNSNVSTASTISYQDSEWHSSVSVTNNEDYFIYGYMPAYIGCTIYQLKDNNNDDLDYSQGAELVFNNMPPVMAEDICVITGVQDLATEGTPVDLTAGKFDYKGKPSGSNFVNLMFDHICSALLFKIKVDADYGKLRIIKLKEVKLKTEDTYIYSGTAGLKINNNPVVRWTYRAPANNDYVTLFTSQAGEELPSTEFKEVYGFFVPVTSVASKLVLQCTYDVYEKVDATSVKLIRENCTATNKLPTLDIGVGKRTVLKLTVAPTYLYVLGEEDLDNPTVTISQSP